MTSSITTTIDETEPVGSTLATAPHTLRGIDGRFLKGASGNLAGRSPGLAAAVQRKAGKDGRRLIQALWLVIFGTPQQRADYFGEPVEVSTKDRLTAVEQLFDRGWGRPAQQLSVDAGGGYVALVVAAASRMNEAAASQMNEQLAPALEGHHIVDVDPSGDTEPEW